MPAIQCGVAAMPPPKDIVEKNDVTAFRVDAAKCRKDGICAQVCPLRIIVAPLGELPVMVRGGEKRCIACGQCVAFCPAGACAAPGIAFDAIRPLRPELYPGPEQVEEFVFARRSIRNFREKTVPREVLARILDAVRFAPSGQNRQALRWIVLETREETAALARLVIDWMRELPETDPDAAAEIRAPGFVAAWERGVDLITRGAPQLAIIAGPKGGLAPQYDAGSALTYLEIVAQAHGVGCCWGGYLSFAFAHPAATAIREHFALAGDEELYSAQMLGYARYKTVSRPPRKPLDVTWRG